jgi:WD40 repeat protein
VVGLPADGSEYSGALAFDPAGAVLAVGNEEGTLRFWDVKDRTPKPLGKPLHTHGLQAAGFVDGGRTLVTVSGDGYVERWNVARGKADGPPRRPVSGVSSAAISADGHTFAFSFGHVSLWDSRRAAAAAPLSGEGAGGPALSADGRTLAVTGPKGIQLWDVRSRRRLGTPFGKGGGLAFSPDGTVLAGADGPIRLYKGILWRDPADLRAQVCGLVLGDLTKAEWAVIAPGLAYRRTCS